MRIHNKSPPCASIKYNAFKSAGYIDRTLAFNCIIAITHKSLYQSSQHSFEK